MALGLCEVFTYSLFCTASFHFVIHLLRRILLVEDPQEIATKDEANI